MSSRRHILKAALAGAASTALGNSAMPVLGLIGPVEATVPPEATRLYPRGVRFEARSVGLKTMTPEGYDSVLERIAPTGQAWRAQAPRRSC
jgi:hypothetical protein